MAIKVASFRIICRVVFARNPRVPISLFFNFFFFFTVVYRRDRNEGRAVDGKRKRVNGRNDKRALREKKKLYIGLMPSKYTIV